LRTFSSVFSQILNLFSRTEFQQLVMKTGAERHARGFRCWDQFVAMMFCQLGRAQSLREICYGLRSAEGKLSHLGIEAPSRTTLSYANAHRNWELFESIFFALLERCRQVAPGHGFRFKNKLYSLDTSTITLCAALFDWAKYKRAKGGIKLHLVLDHNGYLPAFAVIRKANVWDIEVARTLEFPAGSIVVFDRGYNDFRWFYALTKQDVFFVTRMKEATRYQVIRDRPVLEEKGIVLDQDISLIKQFEGVEPVVLRRVEIIDPEGNDNLVFLTNVRHLSAATVGQTYKQRWQIEKVFRELKQNLRIKTFVGTSANALHVQVWTALIALLILRYLKFKTKHSWSLSNLVAMLRFNLFSHRDLWGWLNEPFQPPEPLEVQLSLT
jgi:hypothetical protein